MKKQSSIPFQFVLDELESLHPFTNPMFGCYGVYVGEKIVFALRSRDSQTQDNGVWIATRHEHHATLQNLFPSMRSISVLGKEPTGWQIIPEEADDFEEAVLKLCALVRKGDARIGSIPKPKKKTSVKKSGRKTKR